MRLWTILTLPGASWDERRARLWEWATLLAANRLPRRLAYWAAVRVGVHATTGRWSNQVVPDLTLLDALKRWDEGGS